MVAVLPLASGNAWRAFRTGGSGSVSWLVLMIPEGFPLPDEAGGNRGAAGGSIRSERAARIPENLRIRAPVPT